MNKFPILDLSAEELLDFAENGFDRSKAKDEEIILLTFIHPEPDVRASYKDKLRTFFKESEQEFYENGFSIFETINSHSHWSGAHNELQKDEFARFESIKNRFVPFITLSNLANIYLDLGRKLFMLFGLFDEAKTCFEDIVIFDKNNDEAYYALARVHEKKKEFDLAFEYYSKCLLVNDRNLYALMQLGELHLEESQDYAAAINCFDKAIEMEPYVVENYEKAARAHLLSNNIQRAKQLIEIALGINEFHEPSLNLLGIIQWHYDQDIEKAIETFSIGLDHNIHGDSGLLLASLGDIYCQNFADHEKARSFYEKSLKANFNQASTIQKYIELLENNIQDFDTIQKIYEKYYQIEEPDTEILISYAEFLINYLHDYNHSETVLARVLLLEPENEQAAIMIDQLENLIDHDQDNGEDEEDDILGGAFTDDH